MAREPTITSMICVSPHGRCLVGGGTAVTPTCVQLRSAAADAPPGTTGLQGLVEVRPGCFQCQLSVFQEIAVCNCRVGDVSDKPNSRRRRRKRGCFVPGGPCTKITKITKSTNITKSAAWRQHVPVAPSLLAARVTEGTVERSTEQLQRQQTSINGTIVASKQP